MHVTFHEAKHSCRRQRQSSVHVAEVYPWLVENQGLTCNDTGKKTALLGGSPLLLYAPHKVLELPYSACA